MMTATELANILNGTKPYPCYGIRTDDRSFKAGDSDLGCSRDWDHVIDNYSKDYLPGICATGIGYLWLDGSEDDAITIQKAIDSNSKYCGEHQYLIAGEFADYGEDPDEVIIRNAVVLAVIR